MKNKKLVSRVKQRAINGLIRTKLIDVPRVVEEEINVLRNQAVRTFCGTHKRTAQLLT